MNSENMRPNLRAAALLALRRLATTIVALAIVLAADVAFDGTTVTIIVVAVFVVLVASYVRRDVARDDPERPRDAFDAVAENGGTAAQYAPMIIAIGIFVVADLEPVEFAVVALALFLVSTTLLVWRCNRIPNAPQS